MKTPKKPWYVADPVHHFVEFGTRQDEVKALVATQPFQRLRRISQLGLASLVFPGAIHSRFSHSLGAAHLATRLVEHLCIQDDAARTLVAAALLHDIGHGPFSHSFEHALGQILPECPKHEQWTKAIILGSLAEPLQSQGLAPASVCDLVSPSAQGSQFPAFLRQIISSQLDVDRMDYLCRDAHFTGVPIGKVDLHYLIRNIRVVDHGKERTLGLTSKGVSCYEAFAFARNVMTKTVYYHKQVATFESMMEECIRLLVEADKLAYEPDLIPALRKARGTNPEEFTTTLLEAYLRVTEDQIWTLLSVAAAQPNNLGRLARSLLDRRPVPSYLVAKHKSDVLERELAGEGLAKSQYRVRTLRRSLYSQSNPDQVFLVDRDGEAPVHISVKSSLVSKLGDQPDTDAVLVIFDESAKSTILATATRAHCLDRTESIPPSKPLAKTRGDEQSAPLPSKSTG